MVILAGEILKEVKEFIEQGISSQTVIKGLRRASGMAVNKIKEITANTPAGSQRDTLRKLAATAMTSKLINRNSDFFTKSMCRDLLSFISFAFLANVAPKWLLTPCSRWTRRI